MNMFTDLIKGAKKGANYDYGMEKAKDEISDERLDEIMAELFGGAGSEDEDKAPAKAKKAKKAMPRADLLRAMNKGADMEEEEEEEEEKEDMEKGMTRREMMNKVYSMVDDLSDSELDQFLSSRDIKKAQAMAIFHQMSNSDLKDFMSASAANGEGAHESMGMNKGADMDDEAGAMDNVDEFDE